MHACNKNPATLNTNKFLKPGQSQVQCAHRGDINRNGVPGEYPLDGINDGDGSLEGNFSGNNKPGISRGVTALDREDIEALA